MLDWDDLRFFLAVARHRTMSEAARALRVAQPTVGRRIAAFERQLGARLFVRSGTGWALSPAGQGILSNAEEMEAQFSTTVESYAKPEAIAGARQRRVLTVLDGGSFASSP